MLISTKERKLCAAIVATLPLMACLTSAGVMWPPWPAAPLVLVNVWLWKAIISLEQNEYQLGSKSYNIPSFQTVKMEITWHQIKFKLGLLTWSESVEHKLERNAVFPASFSGIQTSLKELFSSIEPEYLYNFNSHSTSHGQYHTQALSRITQALTAVPYSICPFASRGGNEQDLKVAACLSREMQVMAIKKMERVLHTFFCL